MFDIKKNYIYTCNKKSNMAKSSSSPVFCDKAPKPTTNKHQTTRFFPKPLTLLNFFLEKCKRRHTCPRVICLEIITSNCWMSNMYTHTRHKNVPLTLLQWRNNSKYVIVINLSDVRVRGRRREWEGRGWTHKLGQGLQRRRRRGNQRLLCNTRQTNRSRFYNLSSTRTLPADVQKTGIWSGDQTWGGAQLTPQCSAKKTPKQLSGSGQVEEKCSGEWPSPWLWCVSGVCAAACRLTWWANWSYRGTTVWNCAGESSSGRSFSPAAARGGDDPPRGTWVSCCTLTHCSICCAKIYLTTSCEIPLKCIFKCFDVTKVLSEKLISRWD